MAKTTCFDVAYYFLKQCDDNSGDLISNLKLQKLVYYAQGFALAVLDEPLFSDEIEHWTHGPVIPTLYHHFKSYGNQAISTSDIDFDINIFSKEQQQLLKDVYNVYGQFSAWKLRDMTHEDAPWLNTETNEIITQSAMKEYFKTLTV
ncbi:DUF4065 domain-containing protein [Neisseriaceae bacterium ESL0693]|nr:DUF4065 domain-containing protein [Neisseriaceae bacterium ESL0693]